MSGRANIHTTQRSHTAKQNTKIEKRCLEWGPIEPRRVVTSFDSLHEDEDVEEELHEHHSGI